MKRPTLEKMLLKTAAQLRAKIKKVEAQMNYDPFKIYLELACKVQQKIKETQTEVLLKDKDFQELLDEAVKYEKIIKTWKRPDTIKLIDKIVGYESELSDIQNELSLIAMRTKMYE